MVSSGITKRRLGWLCGSVVCLVCLACLAVPSTDALAQMRDGKGGRRGFSEQPREQSQMPQGPGPQGPSGMMQQPAANEPDNPDFVPRMTVGIEMLKAAAMHGAPESVSRGMFVTGLTQKFADGVYCRDVDDFWAKDYSQTFGGYHVHGGIDIPVPFDTPVRAVADGEVVLKSLHETNPDGVQIWLRHRPEDTGMPIWTFTQYAHLRELPDLALGQRVRMGEIIGITSNTGTNAPEGSPAAARRAAALASGRGGNMPGRRPGIHFAVMYNESGKYYRDAQKIVPVDFRWMDPNAIYRTTPPFDSEAMKALPDDQKRIAIPYMLEDGTTVPAGTKLIWPYPCSTNPLPPTRHNAK